jgi:carotenoid cleavage dioxygenase-like enzyme
MPSSQAIGRKHHWCSAFSQPIQEFPLQPLERQSGTVPTALRGSLYRNGPSLFERNGESIGHWFDGDGAVLGVHFKGDGTVTATYRRVHTAGYLAEAEAGQFKFGNYGRRPPGPFWQWQTLAPKNVANTSVLAVADRLLALWEGGHPYALDRQTLETIGPENLQGLESAQPFSAHPKVDAQTGEIYNFGVSGGRRNLLHLYRCNHQGHLTQHRTITLRGLPLIHDFVLAGPYLLFFISPVYLDVWPLLLHQKSFSETLRWRPERGTHILVVDRHTLEQISQSEAEPWFQWHFSNGYVNAEGQVVVDVVRYADFQTNQFLKEVPSGHPTTIAPGTLWRMHVNPLTAQLTAAVPLSDRACEFPVVNPQQVGHATQHLYLTARSPQAAPTDLFDALAHFNAARGELTLVDLGSNHYPSEPIFAPHPHNPDQGWILTVVYDAARGKSEVWIFEHEHLSDGPICRLALPQVIPFSFHGTWAASL